jgi:chromosome partitioning protein
MLVQASQGQSGSAHVVVLGNEKGGSGKSTVAMHIAIALLKVGQRVATIDLDCRQRSFTRYINNRSTWSRRTGVNLELPVHSCIKLGETMQIADNENAEYRQFADAIHAVERTFDFIVIDTPGTDSYLMRLAHSIADTLVTPINDSFLDLDVLGTLDPPTSAVTGVSHYAELVRDTRRKRRQLDGATADWVVGRNRLSMLGSRNKHLVAEGLSELSSQLGFRTIDGFVERAAYREFFPQGLTTLDDLDDATLGARSNKMWSLPGRYIACSQSRGAARKPSAIATEHCLAGRAAEVPCNENKKHHCSTNLPRLPCPPKGGCRSLKWIGNNCRCGRGEKPLLRSSKNGAAMSRLPIPGSGFSSSAECLPICAPCAAPHLLTSALVKSFATDRKSVFA